MLPLIHWTQIALGPITLQVWGLFVALGIVAGLVVVWRVTASRSAQHSALNQQNMLDLVFWVVLSALVGGRILYVLTNWGYYHAHLIEMLQIWDGGMSITGGYLGATLAGMIYLRIKHLPLLPYIDTALIGLPLGLGIGRLGCFFIYDHPGTPTQFFLGETYLDGIVRHNHGLYLSIDGFLLALLFFFLWKRNPRRPFGTYTILVLLWHGTTRFFLDFFRATDLAISDPRYAGLTAAQYGSVIMVVGGGALWYAVTHGKAHQTKTAKTKAAETTDTC